jgi:RimJ/RimL family protein N-acetyltransferase
VHDETTLSDDARGRGSRPRARFVRDDSPAMDAANMTAVAEHAPDTAAARGARREHGVVIARGTRVDLRTFTRVDLDHLASWVEDPFLERMVGSEFLHAFKHDWDKAPAFHDAVMNDATQIVLMVEARAGGWTKPVGLVRLFNIHLLEGYAFLETIIANERAIRRGFGVEAGKLISYYGVDVLGLRRVEAKVYEYNVLSMNSLKRNGFHQEGVLRQAGYDGTRYWDVVVFGILKDEIQAVRQRDKVYLPLDEDSEGNGD